MTARLTDVGFVTVDFVAAGSANVGFVAVGSADVGFARDCRFAPLASSSCSCKTAPFASTLCRLVFSLSSGPPDSGGANARSGGAKGAAPDAEEDDPPSWNLGPGGGNSNVAWGSGAGGASEAGSFL